MFPAGDRCSLSFLKENAMFAIPVNGALRTVAVLLGGSGHVRPATRTPAVPALLKPLPTVSGRPGSASEFHAAGA
jgi:hypothetical protein